jgi:hypothetical protein
VLFILVYNFFFGDSQEQAQSKKIFGEMRDVVVAVGGLLKTEKQKYDAGKYDEALDKLGSAYTALRTQASNLDPATLRQLQDLEKRKTALQRELNAIEKAEQATTGEAQQAQLERRKKDVQREIEALLRDTDALVRQSMEQ